MKPGRFSVASHLLLGTLLLGATLSQAQAETAWVSDELITYVRSGPTDGYRIIGTLTAGEQVETLDVSGDYTRVRNSNGNAVWVPSQDLSDSPSARDRLPELEAEVASLSGELQSINSDWESRVAEMASTLEQRQARISQLAESNTALESEAEELRQEARALRRRLDTQEEDLLLRYFMYGGGVATAGLIVGVIVPYLPRRRKKRERWFQ